MTTLWHDIRYSLRMLRKNLGITAIAVVTLALGMAGNTVIFSFFNAFFLRPLPFYEPDRLVDLDETRRGWNLEYTGLAYPDFLRVAATESLLRRHGRLEHGQSQPVLRGQCPTRQRSRG